MKNSLFLILAMSLSTATLSQEWHDIPSSGTEGRYQIRPGSMFSVRDDTPSKTLYYGVEMRVLSESGKFRSRETIAFKESDCDKTTGVLLIEHTNKSQTTRTFTKQDGSPYGIAVQVVCNVTRQLLK